MRNKNYFSMLVMSLLLVFSCLFNTSYADVPPIYIESMTRGTEIYSSKNNTIYVNKDFTDGALVEYKPTCVGKCMHSATTTHKKVPIVTDGTATKEEAEELQAMLKIVPYYIVNSFVDDGFKIVLSSKDLREYVGYLWDFEPSGIYSYGDKTIYLSNKYNNQWAVNSLYHEFGHYTDVKYGISKGYVGYISKKEPFNSIYLAEKSKFKVDANKNLAYYQSAAVEMYAQSFAEYIVNPDRLKANTPMTYNYVKNVVESLR